MRRKDHKFLRILQNKWKDFKNLQRLKMSILKNEYLEFGII